MVSRSKELIILVVEFIFEIVGVIRVVGIMVVVVE